MGPSFSRAELRSFTGATLPDLIDDGVALLRPRVVAILGITAYRTAFGLPRATPGRQPEDLAGAQLWVVPKPSGRNAHASRDALAAAYREVALAAGITPEP